MSAPDIEGLIERLREWADRVGRDPVGTPCDDAIPAWEALILAADALHALRRLSEENARLREALEFYEEKGRAIAVYSHKKNGSAIESVMVELMNDAGQRGRAALSHI